ncbi:MAG: nicotinamide-nucleotide amidase [Paludibacterium sp.]|uniref:nicotinamide-nucleotide amidase n=1 Tax=Paludibacterium sp. TaxID=1917523 RepID=UPI0025FD0D0A|nr:nicotinamide-nucleotide amidase [Paludibacterium sp.]MBV8048282.1 nicotinamide-nucleotide amidase [Paludibacterium sp.]MBV8646471.1 nicotinamide-nucleotide amidase [Paludibacterium sp.]
MENIEALARRLGEALRARGETVATAESCTGGMISAALTDIAGSSDWFGYGFVTYSNQAKQDMLGVRVETLAAAGAVSERTVREMAAGALRRAGAHWAVAVSGVAGPGGGSPDKPVGMVWFALAGAGGECEAFVCHFDGDRAAVRRQTVERALSRLIARIEAAPLVV